MTENYSTALRRKVTLEDFITMASTDSEKGPLTAVKCHHLVGGREGTQTGDEIDGFVIDNTRPWSPRDAAERMRGKALVFSQDLRGSQTFKVFFFYGQPEHQASFHFEVIGKTAYDHGETEASDERGARGQGMRLLEAITQTNLSERRETWNMAKHILQELKEDRDHYHNRSLDAEGVVLALIKEKIENRDAARMRELEFQRTTDERKKFILMLPAILHHLTGKSFVSDGMADTAILETAVQHLRKLPQEEQAKALSGMPTELTLILGQRMAEIRAKQEAEEKALALLSAISTKELQEQDNELARSLNGGSASPQLPEKH